MRITKLKIFGFKSFAQRTEVNFPGNGLTAVVGPNGCGKSNIVDAIRWVLGEQRAAVLRMGKMQDVIFSGTEERAAMSMAEVSLVIDNNNGELPSEYSEVMVTRRAYRNGTSEYLLNGQECRLKDVQNLFFDSGLGTGTYSQMNERMINAVLSDKAEDRRALFEEAAGVSKYKKQRKETVSKMGSVQQAMERVEDNLRHTRQSVRQYERQAEKTREWMSLRARLKELDLSVSLDKYEDDKNAIGVLDTSHRRLDHEVESEKARLATLKIQIDERNLAISGDAEALRDLQRAVNDKTLELNNLNNEDTRLRDILRGIESSTARAENEIKDAEAKAEEIRVEASKLEESLERMGDGSDMAAQERELEMETEALQVLRDSCDDLRSRSKEISEERLRLVQTVNSLKNRWQRLDTETAIHQSNIQKWNNELTDLRGVYNNAYETLRTIDSNMESATEELEQLRERRTVQEESIEGHKQELSDTENTLQRLRQEQAALQSRHDVLARMAASEADGSKWVLENRSGLVRGCLGEGIEANPEYLQQIEFALGEALDALVLPEGTSVEDLLSDLENANAGSALFAVLSKTHAVETKAVEGSAGCVANFVNGEGALGIFTKSILSKWMLATDFENAVALADRYAGQDLWFVAPGNRAVHACGMVRGGSAGKSGILSRRAEIAEAEGKLEEIASEISRTEDSKERISGILEEEEGVFATLKDDIQDLEEKIRGFEAAKKIHGNSQLSLTRQIEKLEGDIKNAEDRVAAAEQERSSDAELAEAETQAEKLETEYESVNDRLAEEEQMMRNKEEDVRETERVLRDAKSALSNYQNRLRSLKEQLPVYDGLIKTRSEELERNAKTATETEEKIAAIADQIEAKHEELSVLEHDRDEAQERYNVVSGDLEDWRAEERAINGKLLELVPNIKDIEQRAEAVRMNMQRLRERLFSEWEIDIDNADDIQRVEYDTNSAEREIREIRAKIKALGPVNQGIMEDYEEEKKRLEEVEKQFDDLDRARASLERTIKKLDTIARERFMDTFHKIQRNFQDVFSRLMKDGGTKLTLEEGVDPLEAEIEVNARPTGKKMRGVKALSGGERALTAVSLLFAIYMEKPSPYCVLDEVDGPLDDANIGRFVELLRHFSRQTQFIIVTHNKRTMAASDMLYGVTQEIKGISRIASVKLEDVNPSRL